MLAVEDWGEVKRVNDSNLFVLLHNDLAFLLLLLLRTRSCRFFLTDANGDIVLYLELTHLNGASFKRGRKMRGNWNAKWHLVWACG